MTQKLITELKYAVPDFLAEKENAIKYLKKLGFKSPKTHIGKLYYFLNHLRVIPHFKKDNNGNSKSNGWVEISTSNIKTKFGDLKFFYPMVKQMVEDGWLEVKLGENYAQTYRVDDYCKQYRLNILIKEREWKCVAVKAISCSTTRKIIKEFNNGWKPFDYKLFNMLTQFNIDVVPFFETTTSQNFTESKYKKDLNFIKEKAENKLKKDRVELTEINIHSTMKDIYSSYKLSYISIRDGIWRYKVDKHGRRHTNLTNLPKYLRKYLYVIEGGKKKYFKEVDVSNSQVLLLLTILPKEIKGFDEFKKLVEEGKFYQFMAEKLGREFTAEAKAEIKLQYFTFVYGEIFYENKLSVIIKEVFPELVEWLKKFKIKHDTPTKKEGYKVPAQLMQKAESKIIFNYCSIAALKEGKFFATIHDSFLCFEEDIEYFNESIKEGFKTKELNATTNIDKEIGKELHNFYGYQQEEFQRKINLNQEFSNPQESMIEVCYDYYI